MHNTTNLVSHHLSPIIGWYRLDNANGIEGNNPHEDSRVLNRVHTLVIEERGALGLPVPPDLITLLSGQVVALLAEAIQRVLVNDNQGLPMDRQITANLWEAIHAIIVPS